jgi:class 3 adenylate cyclase
MDPRPIERKLAAILSADVEGYSRLMGDDEPATVRAITEYRGAVASTVAQHSGRVVDAPGDNVLAEFSSVVDAVQCAGLAATAAPQDGAIQAIRAGVYEGCVAAETSLIGKAIFAVYLRDAKAKPTS